jgi:hypothetical protein
MESNSGGSPSKSVASPLENDDLLAHKRADRVAWRAERRTAHARSGGSGGSGGKRVVERSSPASAPEEGTWLLAGGAGIDAVPLHRLRQESNERRLAERKAPRQLKQLADYFSNGRVGLA